MSRVDFYLSEDAPRAACRVAEKAFQLGHRVYLHTADATAAQRLDELLWTFRDVGFVPHALAGTDDDAKVMVGHGEPPPGHDDLLVNLAPAVPAFHDRFARVAEMVGGDEAAKADGRARFRYHRERGHEPETHQI